MTISLMVFMAFVSILVRNTLIDRRFIMDTERLKNAMLMQHMGADRVSMIMLNAVSKSLDRYSKRMWQHVLILIQYEILTGKTHIHNRFDCQHLAEIHSNCGFGPILWIVHNAQHINRVVDAYIATNSAPHNGINDLIKCLDNHQSVLIDGYLKNLDGLDHAKLIEKLWNLDILMTMIRDLQSFLLWKDPGTYQTMEKSLMDLKMSVYNKINSSQVGTKTKNDEELKIILRSLDLHRVCIERSDHILNAYNLM